MTDYLRQRSTDQHPYPVTDPVSGAVTYLVRSSVMSLLHEQLAREHVRSLRAEAEASLRAQRALAARRVVKAARRAQRADAAARRARLALASLH